MRKLTLSAAALLALVACSPTTPSPEPTAPVPSMSPTGVDTDVAGSPTASSSDDGRRLEPLPQEEYPAEVDGHTLVWSFGAPSYDIDRGTAADSERISVTDMLVRDVPGEYSGLDLYDDVREVLPEVFCYPSRTSDLLNCLAADETGRLWEGTQMFGSKSVEELAAWMEQFLEAV